MNRTLFNTLADVKYRSALRILSIPVYLIVTCIAFGVGQSQLNAQDTIPHIRSFQHLNSSNSTGFPWSETNGMDCSMVGIGDVDGNGIHDLAVGYPELDGGRGRVGIVFFGGDYEVGGFEWIGNGLGGFPTQLDSLDHFGIALVSVGDLNGNGVPDIAVLAPGADTAGTDLGAIHILFMNNMGTVDSSSIIASGTNGFVGPITGGGELRSLASCPDLNGDGRVDLLVGIPTSNLGGNARGALVALMLNSTGGVLLERVYSANSTWPDTYPLNTDSMFFGASATGLGDVDADGVGDIAVTAPGGNKVLTILLNDNGSVKSWFDAENELSGALVRSNNFGHVLGRGQDVDMDEVNELFIADPDLQVGMKTVGGIHFWNAVGAEGPELARTITSGFATDGTKLELSTGSRFGDAFSFLGDSDGDGLPEIIVSAPGIWPSVTPEFVIVHLNPAPIQIHLTIKDQTADSLGSVSLRTTGGIPPYRIEWSKELLDPAQFEGLKDDVDTEGLEALGFVPPYQTDFTAEELLAMVGTHLVDVKAGLYWVGVEDFKEQKAETEFAVGLELLTLVEIGATTSDDKKEVSKSSGDGWTNMQLKTKNLLPKKEDGWVRFKVPEKDMILAVGFKDIETTDIPGYEHLEYAFYFTDNKFQFWNGEALVGDLKAYDTKDVFQLERLSNAIHFSRNDKVEYVLKPIDDAIALTINVAIFTEGGTVSEITTNLRSSFGIAASITHTAPLAPGSGVIALDLPSALGPYTYSWSIPGQTGSTVTNVAPGEYVVDVTSAHFDHTASRTYRVGHQILWEEPTYQVINDGIGANVTYSELLDPLWEKSILSKNMVRSGAGHHIIYRPYPIDYEFYGSIVGVRSSTDDRIWAGWWIFSFGESHIAQTISRTGDVKRVMVNVNDELEIVLHTYSIHFLKNGEIVHTVDRGIEGASHLLVALHSKESMIRDLRTTLPIPIQLNTSLLIADREFEVSTPDGVSSSHTTGIIEDSELGADLPVGPYIIQASNSPPGSNAAFDLVNGHPTDLKYTIDSTSHPIDSALFEFRGINELILYDEPEILEPEPKIPFQLSLHGQLVMTPNSDGLNDTFLIIGTVDPTTFQLTIRDLQENLLFQTTDVEQAWNGKFMNTGTPVPSGIYNYSIDQPGGPINGQFMVKR